MISENLQRIYNNHLAITRSSQGKPFKIRKNFDKFDETKIIYLERLERFFNSNPTVNVQTFFEAPFKVFPDETHYDLEFYTKPKAVKIYSQYIKQRELENPDTEEAMIRFRDALKFVSNFCKEKGLTLDEYGAYCEGNLPCFIQHLKDHKINFYVLHSLSIKINIEKDILDFIFSDFHRTFQQTRNKFMSSKKMKKFSELAKLKLTKKNKQTTENK